MTARCRTPRRHETSLIERLPLSHIARRESTTATGPAGPPNGSAITAPEPRFLLYSHDGLGLGHVRRNLAIAAALAEAAPEAPVLLATSADEVFDLGVPETVEVLKLPGMRKVANGVYTSRRLPIPSDDVSALRGSLLVGAVASFKPTVLLVDKHPFGIGGELRPALARHRERGGKAVLGLRDILDDAAAVIEDWSTHDIPASIVENYDRVFVYGTPSVFDAVSEYRLPRELRRMASYCGYVSRPVEHGASPTGRPRGAPRPFVLATAGGGADGHELLATFAAAAAGMPWNAVVVSGRQASPAERERLRGLSQRAGVSFRTFVPKLSSWFASVDALVCMGGYNTLVEAAAAGVPTVCVPRSAPRTEQLLRATAFERLGLLRTIDAGRLDAELLRAAVAETLATPRTQVAAGMHQSLDLGGAPAAAAGLLDLAAGVGPVRTPALVAG